MELSKEQKTFGSEHLEAVRSTMICSRKRQEKIPTTISKNLHEKPVMSLKNSSLSQLPLELNAPKSAKSTFDGLAVACFCLQ